MRNDKDQSGKKTHLPQTGKATIKIEMRKGSYTGTLLAERLARNTQDNTNFHEAELPLLS